MDITRTKHGLRMSQHGVLISELRTTPGPTHSVSDLLAAIIGVMKPEGRIGVLGFAGGGMQAPLAALGVEVRIDTVDLDRAGYELFSQHCPAWISRVNWKQADAVEWLRSQPKNFDLLVEDLSVPDGDDVFKPPITWDVLPELIRDLLAPHGVAVFNLLPPPTGVWLRAVECMAGMFGAGQLVAFDDFENRILVAGKRLPSARDLGARLREALRGIRSRQADRIHVRTVRGTAGRNAS